MEVELIVNKDTLPKNGFEKLQVEVTRRLKEKYPNILIKLRGGPSSHILFQGVSKTEKTFINEILSEMFDEADSWMFDEFS